MKVLLILACLGFSSGEEFTTDNMRTWYYQASESGSFAHWWCEKMKETRESQDPLVIGYRGMSKFMICYHALNPMTKWSYFKQGTEDLERAIGMRPDLVELRFLRLSVQINAPGFLGYNKSLHADKQMVLKGLGTIEDPIFRQRIVDYMVGSDLCTTEEKDQLKAAL